MNKKQALIAFFLIPFISLYAINASDVEQRNTIQSLKKDHSKHEKQKVKIKNKTSMPAIANILVSTPSGEAKAGYYGVLLSAHKDKKETLPEFYWFEKQATGGFKRPDEPSKVRIIDVLNHGFANKIEIIIPNNRTYSFDLAQKKYTIVIQQNENDQIEVIMQQPKKASKAPAEKENSLFHEIEKDIDRNF